MQLKPKRIALAVLGAGIFVLFYRRGVIEHREPFYTYFYLFAWSSFLWVVYQTVAHRQSFLNHPKGILWTMLLSTTVWLGFEMLNLHLKNWVYVSVPAERWLRWPMYALAFSTVIPGLLMVRKIFDSYVPKESLPDYYAVRLSYRWVVVGAAMLALSMIWPRVFFPLVWVAFFLMLDPWIESWGMISLMQDWRHRRWRKTMTLLGAGLVCGLFWEGCNFGAGAKWSSTLPPLLGFIGFLPFALEVHVIYLTAGVLWERRTRFQQALIGLGMLAFWAIGFTAIDRYTVVGWR